MASLQKRKCAGKMSTRLLNSTMPDLNNYDAKQIQVLEGLEPVRKRPGMYIGSTDERGLWVMIKEIIDNSVDEAMAGRCKNVWITLHNDNFISVADDGL